MQQALAVDPAHVPPWHKHLPPNSFLAEVFEEGMGGLGKWNEGERKERVNQEWESAVAGQDYATQLGILVVRAVSVERIDNFFEGFKIIREAEEILPRLPSDAVIRIPFYNMASRTYSKINLHRRALAYDLREFQLIQIYVPGIDQYHFRNLNRVAGDYQQLGVADSALVYLRLGAEMTRQTGDSLYWSSSLNNLGMLFYDIGQLDSAQRYYAKAIALIRPDGPLPRQYAGIYAATMDNWGLLLESQGRYREALALHRRVLGEVDSIVHTGRRAKIRFRIASQLFRLGQVEDAARMLGEIPEEYISNLLTITLVNSDYEAKLLELLLDVYLEMGDLEKAQQFIRGRRTINRQRREFYEEETHEALKYMVRESDNRLQQALAQADLEVAHQKSMHEVTRLRVFLLLALIATFIIVASLLVYRRNVRLRQARSLAQVRKQLLEKELENNKLRQDQLNADLENKKKDLAQLAVTISAKREFGQETLESLRELLALAPEERTAALKTLIFELGHKLNVGEEQEVIQENIDQVNTEFFQKLDARFPKLTRTERSLCSLLRLNLSNKEIAELRNVSPSAVKVGKNRLRKKLSLEAGADLSAFLNGM